MVLVMALLLVLCVGAVSAADNADMVNGVVLNDGDNDTGSSIVVSNITKVNTENDDVIIPVEVTKNGTVINVTKEDLSIVLGYVNSDKKDFTQNITNFTVVNNTISFNIKNIEKIVSGVVSITYQDECNEITNLEFYTPGIKVEDTTNVNIDNYDVNVLVTVIDSEGNIVTINKDDLKLVLDYTYKTDNITENGTNGTINVNTTLNITNFTVENNTVSFNIADIKNITAANLVISYKDNLNVTTKLNFILDCEIVVITDECNTEYQNCYFVVQLWDTVLNKTVANKSVSLTFENSSVKFVQSFTTDENGRINVTDNQIYLDTSTWSFGYIPVGTGYRITVSPGEGIVATSKAINFNITAVEAVFSAPNYSSTYGSGAKWTVTLKNKKSGTTIKDLATIKLYSNKKCTSKYLIGTFSVTTGVGVGINLAPGTYYVKIFDASSNYKASAYPGYRTIVIKKVTAKISAKATTAYYKGNNTFKVKMVNKSTGKALIGASVLLNIYTGKKFKAVQLTTDDKGYASWTVSGISIAKHKVLVGSNAVPSNIVTTYINYKKAPTTVSAPKVTNKCGLNEYLTIKVTRNVDKAALSGLALTVKVYNSKNKLVKTFSAKTDKTGVAKINTKTLAAGTYKVVITSSNKYYAVSKTVKSGIVMQKQKTVVTAPSVTNICGKKSYFKINVAKVDGGKVISGLVLTAKVYNSKGKLVKSYSLKTDSKGNAYVNTKDLAKGTYKVTISSSNKYYAVSKSVSNAIVMTKYSTKVVADNITAKYKKNGYFKVNITNVEDKPINGLSVVVKVYKGSKLVKTYTTTTNANGIATINTKALAKGTYKVAISTKNVSYAVSKTINNAIKII